MTKPQTAAGRTYQSAPTGEDVAPATDAPVGSSHRIPYTLTTKARERVVSIDIADDTNDAITEWVHEQVIDPDGAWHDEYREAVLNSISNATPGSPIFDEAMVLVQRYTGRGEA